MRRIESQAVIADLECRAIDFLAEGVMFGQGRLAARAKFEAAGDPVAEAHNLFVAERALFLKVQRIESAFRQF